VRYAGRLVGQPWAFRAASVRATARDAGFPPASAEGNLFYVQLTGYGIHAGAFAHNGNRQNVEQLCGDLTNAEICGISNYRIPISGSALNGGRQRRWLRLPG